MTLESKLKEKTMASKWREFWLIRWALRNYEPRIEVRKTKPSMNELEIGDERIHVVERAALDEALELINKSENALKLAQGAFNDGWAIDWAEIDRALLRIKAFKDRESNGRPD